MKHATIAPSWMYLDPFKIIDRLLARSSREVAVPARPVRDKYYVQARRLRIRQAMKTR